jgi:hypothetical protein
MFSSLYPVHLHPPSAPGSSRDHIAVSLPGHAYCWEILAMTIQRTSDPSSLFDTHHTVTASGSTTAASQHALSRCNIAVLAVVSLGGSWALYRGNLSLETVIGSLMLYSS